jgi:hypothetical protein
LPRRTIGATEGIIIPAIMTTHIANVTSRRAPQHGMSPSLPRGPSFGSTICARQHAEHNRNDESVAP